MMGPTRAEYEVFMRKLRDEWDSNTREICEITRVPPGLLLFAPTLHDAWKIAVAHMKEENGIK